MDPVIKTIPQCPARVTIPAFATAEFHDALGNLHGKFDVPQPLETKVILEWPNDNAPFTVTFTDHTPPAPAQDDSTLPQGCIDV
jgi:hypothetical protein